jgi:ABC-2 type transport system permease protein
MSPTPVLMPTSRCAGASTATPRSRWNQYPRIYTALTRNSIARDMTFKANFLFWIFVELVWFGLQLAFNDVIYLHTDRIGTWTRWEVVLLIGTSHFIQQLFQALFLVNCSNLAELVHTGKFDFVLLFPVNTRFLVSCRQIDLTGFISALSGLAVLAFAVRQLGLHPSLLQLACFAGLCAAAVLIHYSLMFAMASISFWSVRAQGIMMAYYNLFSIARIPDVAFAGASRAFFTLVIPMLLVSNVPVKLLAKTLSSPVEITLMLSMCVSVFIASAVVWKCALRHYTSASS